MTFGPFDWIVSRSYIGGDARVTQQWEQAQVADRTVVRSTSGLYVEVGTAEAISKAMDWLEDELGFEPLVNRIEWHFVPRNSEVFEVRTSFGLRGKATMSFWEPAGSDARADTQRAVRSLAHELTHLQTSLRGIRIDAEADEHLAYLVEHCAVLQVFGEVRRLPLARLRGGDRVRTDDGIVRSINVQRAVVTDLPPRIASGTVEAERLMHRCRVAVREAGVKL